jgi:hypothetical protein
MTDIPYPDNPNLSVEHLNLWLVREFPRTDPDVSRWAIMVPVRGAGWHIRFNDDADASLFLLKWNENARY